MHILPKKQDIDREKNLERKKEIDSGVQLATRIDKLRETKANEERALFEWRKNSIKLIQREIDDYITVRDNLKNQTEEAEVYRKKLLEPLDNEWILLNQEKNNIIEEQQNMFLLRKKEEEERKMLDKEILQIKETVIEINEKHRKVERLEVELSEIVAKSKQDKENIEKIKSESILFKELSEKELRTLEEKQRIRIESLDKASLEILEKQKKYEFKEERMLDREKELKERESKIIIKERYLSLQLNKLNQHAS